MGREAQHFFFCDELDGSRNKKEKTSPEIYLQFRITSVSRDPIWGSVMRLYAPSAGLKSQLDLAWHAHPAWSARGFSPVAPVTHPPHHSPETSHHLAPPTPTRNVLWISRGPELRPSDLSDARVIREGPTTADVYIDISPFYGMAPATVSGYADTALDTARRPPLRLTARRVKPACRPTPPPITDHSLRTRTRRQKGEAVERT